MPGLVATHPVRLEASERHAEAFKLRLAGHDYATIADKLGYTNSSSVNYAITAELEKRVGPHREAYRQLLLAREEEIWAKAYAKFEASEELDLELIDRLLKILDRMAKHSGVESTLHLHMGDQAKQADEEPKADPQEQIQSLLSKLRARVADQAKPLDVIDHAPGGQNYPPETNGHNGNGHAATSNNGE